jgi:hypothetical protein
MKFNNLRVLKVLSMGLVKYYPKCRKKLVFFCFKKVPLPFNWTINIFIDFYPSIALCGILYLTLSFYYVIRIFYLFRWYLIRNERGCVIMILNFKLCLWKIDHYCYISLGHFINLDDISRKESGCVITILSNAYIIGFHYGVGSKYIQGWVTLWILQVVRCVISLSLSKVLVFQ